MTEALRNNNVSVGESGAHCASFVRSKKDPTEGDGECSEEFFSFIHEAHLAFFFHFMNDLSASFPSTAECQKQTASSMPCEIK